MADHHRRTVPARASQRSDNSAGLIANLILFGAAGAATGFFVWRLVIPARAFNSYLFFNRIPPQTRGLLFVLSSVGGVLFVAAGLAAARFSASEQSKVRLMALRTHAFLPGCLLLGFVPALAVPAIEVYHLWLTFCLVAGLTGAATGLAWRAARIYSRPNLTIARPRAPDSALRGDHHGRAATALAVGLTIAYALYFAFFTIGRHRSFHTHAFDLGWQVQAFSTLVRTGNPRVTIWATLNHLGNHFQPVYYLVAPFYAIHQDATTLLVLQSLWLSSAAIPIYLIARRRLDDSRSALVFALAYLLYPPLHGVNNYDFHGLSLLVPVTALLLYANEYGRRRLFWVLFAVGLMVREDAPISLAGVGLYLLLGRESRRKGTIIIGVCAGYFILTGIVMSALDGYPDLSNYWKLTLPFRRDFIGVLATLLSNPSYVLSHVFLDPAKLEYLIQLLLPLAFLPLLAGRDVLLAVPGLAIMLLSNTFFNYSIATPYSSHVIVPLFFLAIVGAGRLRRWNERRPWASGRLPMRFQLPVLLVPLIVGSIAMNTEFGLVASKRFPGFLGPSERLEAAYELFELIPEDAPVSTDTRFVPHLANRDEIRLAYAPNSECRFLLLDIASREPALDPHEGWYRTTQYPGVAEARVRAIDALESGRYGVVRVDSGLVLLERGADTSANAAAIRRIRSAPVDEVAQLISYYADPADNVDPPPATDADAFYRLLTSGQSGTFILAMGGSGGEAMAYLSLKRLLYIGSAINTVHRGGSWIAVIRDGVVAFEAIDNNATARAASSTDPELECLFPDLDIEITSEGGAAPGHASIRLNDMEVVATDGGIAAVVLDRNNRVREARIYDIGR